MSDSRSGRIDPIAAGLADAGASGFRALEAVAEGLAEAVSMRSAGRTGRTDTSGTDTSGASTGGADTGRRARAGAAGPAAGALAEDLLRVLGDLLDRAGGVAHAVADALAEPDQPPQPQPDPDPPSADPATPARLVLTAPAGEQASGTFTYWNTGTVTLTDVRFGCTDLVAGGERITGGEVTFTPASVDRLAPGEGATVVVTVAGRAERAAADYHGVLTGEPGAGAVLLTARSTPKR